MFLASLDIKTAFDEARPMHIAKFMESHNIRGWLIAALLREMWGSKERPCSTVSKALSDSIDVCAKEASKLTDCGKWWSPNTLPLWKESGNRKTWVSCWTSKERRCIRYAVLCRPSLLCPTNRDLEQMQRNLIEEAGEWDLTPKTCRSDKHV